MLNITFLNKVLSKVLFLSLYCINEAWAEEAKPIVVDTSNSLRVILALAIVLATIVLLAWTLNKATKGKLGGSGILKIVGGVSVGTRERVVVLEIQDRYLVVGVSPGRISAIADLPQLPASIDNPVTDQPTLPQEKSFLAQLLQKINQSKT